MNAESTQIQPIEPAQREPPWLVTPGPGHLFIPLSGAWILGLDWLLFSQDVITLGLSIPILSVVGFVLGGGGVYFFQRRFARDTRAAAAAKALLAAIAVGIPWPLAGTVMGGWILVRSGLDSLFRSNRSTESKTR